MAEVAIRVPSVDRFFDEWSAEPLERRPLDDGARERILYAWHEGHVKRTPPDRICLILPESERSERLERLLPEAFRFDMEQMCFDTHDRWVRKTLNARETRVGFLVFLIAMIISVLISSGSDGDSLETLFAQSFVVVAWVALWGPAGRFIRGASYRLERRSFARLEKTPVEIRWE